MKLQWDIPLDSTIHAILEGSFRIVPRDGYWLIRDGRKGWNFLRVEFDGPDDPKTEEGQHAVMRTLAYMAEHRYHEALSKAPPQHALGDDRIKDAAHVLHISVNEDINESLAK